MKGWWQPLFGVGVGWLLSQGTEWWRQKRRARQYRQAIYLELRDVHSTIKTRLEIMKVILCTYISTRKIEVFIVDVKSYIFQSHFADAILQLTESERLALIHIYTLIESLNFNFSIIRENWDITSGDEEANNEKARKIIQVTEGSYTNAREIDVMIELLLRDREHFNIRDPQNGERLNRIGSEAEAELRTMIAENQPKSSR